MLVTNLINGANSAKNAAVPLATVARWGTHGVKPLATAGALQASAGLGFVALVLLVYEVSRHLMKAYAGEYLVKHPHLNFCAENLLFTSIQFAGASAAATVLGMTFTSSWLLVGAGSMALIVKQAMDYMDSKGEEVPPPPADIQNLVAAPSLVVTQDPTLKKMDLADDMIVHHEGTSPSLLSMIGEADLELVKKMSQKHKIKTFSSDPIANCSAGVALARGKKPTMEDVYKWKTLTLANGEEAAYFGVFDGHGGVGVAKFLQSNMQNFLTLAVNATLEQNDNQIEFSSLKTNIKESFKKLNAHLGGQRGQIAARCGSTAVVLLVYRNVLYLASTGDSRGILSIDGVARNLVPDAKPTEQLFAKTIEKNGGTVILNEPDSPDEPADIPRVGGVLAVARAFGDFIVPGITPVPKVEQFNMTRFSDDPTRNFAVLVCDGITDVFDSQDIVDGVKSVKRAGGNSEAAAQVIVDEALQAGSGDNCTAMVIDLPLVRSA